MLFEIDSKPSFRIDLYDNIVAHKWKKLIQSIYVGDGNDIDHKRTFLHLRTIQEIQDMLLEAIEIINKFLKSDFIKVPKNIDWDDQSFYNNLHIAFEKLSGEHDNQTRLMKIAPVDVQESIRDLNYCIHAIENENNRDGANLRVQWTKARKNTPRIKLQDEEYDLMQFHKVKNEVYLAYNELGKDNMDLWRDGLPADYAKTKEKHYIGADIDISFVDRERIFEDDFLEWCKTHDIDAYKKENGMGLLPIGKISSFDPPEHLTKHSKIDIIEGVN